MGWPQVTYVGLIALSLGITLAQHGKPRTGNFNVVHSLIGASITTGVVYAGGFFG